ncbi:MAG: hypothetical protein AB7G76_11315 [Steroidobacteraceae bacterium]
MSVRAIVGALAILAALFLAGCATASDPAVDAGPPVLMDEPLPMDEPIVDRAPAAGDAGREAEIPLSVLQPEPEDTGADALPEVLVKGLFRARHEIIHDHVAEAQALLREVELGYVFTGKGKRETLRGRPVAFALWSEAKQEWLVAHIEIPRPPVRWRPGRKPLRVVVRTPDIEARHVNGSGAERLMVAFSRGGEPLKVYGRKFPVFDNALVRKRRWRAVAGTARPIIYLPYTDDTFDPGFVSGGREFLLSEARKAADELRTAQVASRAFPGEYLADVIPVEVITTLAVIEQTDDFDFRRSGAAAFDRVLNQYGLERRQAYRYSVSVASALGPMQFTNRRGNGTYALVVRRCHGAGLDPNFERGATNLRNAMKAAICLLDIELAQMRRDIRLAYRDNPAVLGIFPVAAYNGGPRNVAKLDRALGRMKVGLGELRRPGEQPTGKPVPCPCVWQDSGTGDVRPVTIPRYNNENRWYIEKYQSILNLFE